MTDDENIILPLEDKKKKSARGLPTFLWQDFWPLWGCLGLGTACVCIYLYMAISVFPSVTKVVRNFRAHEIQNHYEPSHLIFVSEVYSTSNTALLYYVRWTADSAESVQTFIPSLQNRPRIRLFTVSEYLTAEWIDPRYSDGYYGPAIAQCHEIEQCYNAIEALPNQGTIIESTYYLLAGSL
jgi:hypothetical protein